MKNKLLLTTLYLCAPIFLFAQGYTINGRINDSITGKSLPFVNISAQQANTGTASDIDGHFSLKLPSGEHELEISFIGYEKKKITVNKNSKFLKIQLVEESSKLQEVTIFPGENPAHRIIKNAVANRDRNNPINLESFSYRTYSKFAVSLSVDTSITESISELTANDSVVDAINAKSDSTESDTSEFDYQSFLENHYIFMSETVTERKFLPPSRDNETVLASRTSGFKNPMFALLTTQMQSFSFYSDYISIAGSDFLNPITPASTKRYFFLLEDTLYNSATDTVFVVSYRPRPNYGFQPLKGLLYINTSSWAIQNVIAEPVENEGARITIEQRYKEYTPGTWFPDQLRAEILFGSIELNGLEPIAQVRTYLSDVKIGAELKKKDISKALVTIDELAANNPEILLTQYRTDSISDKEARSYNFIDSISDEANLEKRFNYLTAVFSGKLPVWYFDLDLDKILRYNTYEGFRLGLGAHTNARFSRWFKVGGYYGYGFKDEVIKYGWDAEATINKHSNFKIKGGYNFDIYETGGTEFIQSDAGRFFSDHYRQLFIPQWDEASRYFTSVTYDPSPQLHLMVKGQRENRYTIGDYYFDTGNGSDQPLENGFTFFEVITAINWTPRQEYVEAPGMEKLLLKKVYPIVQLQYTRGISETFDSEFEYNKIDLSIEQHYKTARFGESVIELRGGTVLEDIPYSKLYVGTANSYDKEGFWKRNGQLADRHSFETMRFNEFVSDTYAQILLRQDFRSLLFRREKFAPHIELVARGLWGNLRSPEKHHNVSTKTPTKGFYEAGFETNKLLKNNFLSLGFGFYYRIGDYAFDQFEDNFAFKITSKYTL